MSQREEAAGAVEAEVEAGGAVAGEAYAYDEAYAQQQHDEHAQAEYAEHHGVVQNPYGPGLNMDNAPEGEAQGEASGSNVALDGIAQHYAEAEGTYASAAVAAEAAAAAAAAAHHQQVLLHRHSQEQQAQHALAHHAAHAHASTSSAPESAAAASAMSSSSRGTKRKQVKNACINCARACKKCDESRPCERCLKLGHGETCQDSPRKERPKGVKRGPYKKKRAMLLGATLTPSLAHSHEYQQIQQQRQAAQQQQHQQLLQLQQQQQAHQQAQAQAQQQQHAQQQQQQ